MQNRIKEDLKGRIKNDTILIGKKIINSSVIMEEDLEDGYLTNEEIINAKLKDASLMEVKKKIINKKKRDFTNYEENVGTTLIDKIKNISVYAIKLGKVVVTSKTLLITLVVGLLLILILSSLSGVTSVLGGINAAVPDVKEADVEKLIDTMDILDKSCGAKLKSDYVVTGSKTTDWNTVLSLLLGYYENDFDKFDDYRLMSSSKIAEIYNKVNEVESYNVLNRHDFYSIVDKLGFNEKQIAIAKLLYEEGFWVEIFPDEFNFNFKIHGSYTEGSDVEIVAGDRKKIIDVAKSLLGIPYLWGGKCPASQTPTALDCSGYIAWVYEKALGYGTLQGGGTYYQINFCTKINEEMAQPGDLAFTNSLSHVLIYAGKKNGVNYFYHAPRTGDVIKCSTYSTPVNFYKVTALSFND